MSGIGGGKPPGWEKQESELTKNPLHRDTMRPKYYDSNLLDSTSLIVLLIIIFALISNMQ